MDDALHDERIKMARYLVRCAFAEALRGADANTTVMTVMVIARVVALELLDERSDNHEANVRTLNAGARLLENMTDRMAREAGFK